MILENTGLKGIKAEFRFLEEAMEKEGFVRGQWEYKRATYDCKIPDGEDTYYLRINARAVEGKLEKPFAVLALEDAYIGKTTFPHGLDYSSPIPGQVLDAAQRKINDLKQRLA